MASNGGINGAALVGATAGAILVYSAVKGNNVSKTVRDLLAGQTPPDTYQSAIGGSGSAPLGGVPPASGGGNQMQTIQAYMLNNMQFSKAGAAGGLGNIQVESGFSPTSYNPNEGAIGICQWEGGRRTGLQALAAANGMKETDIRAQLMWMNTELSTAFAPVGLYMRGASDPASAAAFWDQYYEISAGTSRAQRIANAQALYAGM